MGDEARGQRRAQRAAEHSALLDTTRCPACGAQLSASSCGACGIDLSGPEALRLWELSQRAAVLLAEREALLRRLEGEAEVRSRVRLAPMAPPRRAPVVPSPVVPSTGLPFAVPPVVLPTAVPARPSPLSRIGVQGAFVALGALLLAVAGVLFLVVAWDRLSLGVRALIIAAVTGAAMGGAAWLRPRLAETAEAIGGVAVVLVLADAWAVRATGLLGADRPDGAAYGALAAALTAALLLAWGAASGVRAGSVAAALVGPVAPVLVGGWLADDVEPALSSACLGLIGAAVVALARRWAPPAWRAERQVLRVTAALTTGLAVVLCPTLVGAPGSLTAVLALISVTALLQVVVETASPGARAGWSAVCGATAALAAAALASATVARAGLDPAWRLALAPASASAVAWGVLVAAGRRRPLAALVRRRAASAARGTAILLTVPAGALVGTQVVSVVLAAVTNPWSLRPVALLAELTGRFEAELGLGGPGLVTALPHLAAVTGLAAAAVLFTCSFGGSFTGSGPNRWAAAVAAVAGLAAVGAPLSPRLTVPLAAPLLVVVAVVAAAGAVRAGAIQIGPGRPLVARAGLAVAGVAGTIGVLTAWAVREICVPATVLGLGGLLLARIVVSERVRPFCLAAFVLSAAVTGGAVAGLAGAGGADRVTVAAVVGGVLIAVAVAVPLPTPGAVPIARAERLAAASAGFLAVAAGVAVALTGPFRSDRLAITLGVSFAAAACGAARRSDDGPAGPTLPLALSAVLSPLAVAGAASATDAWWPGPAGAREVVLCAAAMVLLSAVAVAVLGIRAPAEVRRVPAELGAGAAGVITLLAGSLALAEVEQRWLWVLWLLIGVAVYAAATPGDRRRLGWGGWVLLTVSSWSRLRQADIGLVEAYTLPPALVLLAVRGWRLRRDRSAAAWRRLLPALCLALVPSVVAASSGPTWRPAILLALATAGLLLAWRAPAPREVALTVSAMVAAGVGLARPLRAMLGGGTTRLDQPPYGVVAVPEWYRVEVWSLSSAALLVVAAALAWHSISAEFLGRPLPGYWRRYAAVPAQVVAAVPTLVVALSDAEATDDLSVVLRTSAVVAAAGALAVARALRPRTILLTQPVGRTASATMLAAAWLGWCSGWGIPELWTAPPAAVLLAVGVLGMRRVPELRSWRALGPGLVLLLVPTLVLALEERGPSQQLWRILLLTVTAAGVVALGGWWGRQAPVVLGGGVLAFHAIAQLGPWLAGTVAAMPRWVVLGAVGSTLLALGATYERQLRELRRLRLRIGALR